MKFYQVQEDLKKGDMVFIDKGDIICKVKKQDGATQHFKSFFEEFVFGKYSHLKMTLQEVIDSDKQYVKWCLENGVISVDEKIENRFNRKLGLD